MNKMQTNKDIFNNIYASNSWGYKSGQGSDPKYAQEWIDLVNNFIKKNNIKTVLDLGCGDWRIGKELNLQDVRYTGVEVSSIIFDEIINNEKDNIKFINSDIKEFEFPQADLILIKDVLQHLDVDSVKIIMNKIFKSTKYALISNDYNFEGRFSKSINNLTKSGAHMYVDFNLDPFNYDIKKVFDFKSDTQIKRVYLFDIDNSAKI
jgi:SAM-dependent methyltransferase